MATNEGDLIQAHEQASSAMARDQASIQMIETALLPEGRLSEAEMWARSIVNKQERQKKRAQIQELKTQIPLFRLTHQISRSDKANLISSAEVSQQQSFYDLLIDSLFSEGLDGETRRTLSTWPGPGMTGFVNGIWTHAVGLSDAGCQRETLAMAVFDRLHFDIQDPLGSEEWSPEALEAPYRALNDVELTELVKQGNSWALKEAGLRLDRSGHTDDALKIWTDAAGLGNHAAMRNIGVYWLNQGNSENAELWLNRALEAGNKTVFHAFADLYQNESDDIVESWLRRGVEANDDTAINNLGYRLQSRREYDEAIELYRRAAEFGNTVAATNLAKLLYHFGKLDECQVWLERAIDGGDLETQETIAEIQNMMEVQATMLLVSDDPETHEPQGQNRKSATWSDAYKPSASKVGKRGLPCGQCRHPMDRAEKFCTQCGSPRKETVMQGNDFYSRCEILGELWFAYRDDEEFEEFISYSDIGLPLAYLASQNLVTIEPQGEIYINETWDLLVEALGADPEASFEDLEDLLDSEGTYEAEED